MKPNELRIGDWVETFEGVIQIQNGWEIDEGNECQPIPLTEEWLLKFRFDDEGFKQYDLLNWGLKIKKDPNSLGNWIAFQGFMNQFSELTSIQYVHQLQNLYFAITGEELTIKQ